MAIEQLAEEVVNEVASNFEEAAAVTRSLNVAGLSYFVVGLGVGAAAGFYFGYKFNREKIRAEAYKEAEVEVAQLREVYLQKTLASVNFDKPPVEEVVENLGYSVQVPTRERPLPAPVPILDDLPENPVGTSKSMNAGWNYETELETRSPEAPYVIHQNEYEHSQLEYSKVVYTYWAVDDVVTDTEDNHPIPHGDIVVGLDNLKFGHGSDDIDVVYVRNDRLDMDMQICRVNQSFEEEVLGLQGLRDDDDDDDS
jgi:hypothetical protein